MSAPNPKRLDAGSAAELLGVSTAMILRWSRQGLLTSIGAASAPSFELQELKRWARVHGIQLHRVARDSRVSDDFLAQAIERGLVMQAAGFGCAAEAIKTVGSALAKRLYLTDELAAQLEHKLLERESMATTAMGMGVAVPHPREPQPQLAKAPHVAAMFLEQPLDWAALDGQPVHTVLLLLSPNSREHLQVLSRVAFALRSEGFADWLQTRPTQAELVSRLRGIKRES